MKRNLAVVFILAAVFGLSLFSSPAQADPITTYLTICNEDLGLTGDFATVTVAITDPNKVQFTVNANEALLGGGNNFGIQRFGFNSTLDLSDAIFTLPDGWGSDFNDNISEFGIFYADESGTGKTRQDPLIFTLEWEGISDETQFYVANADGYHYVAHIAGFAAQNGLTSAYFSDSAAPVPEPATLLLLGSGLLGLAGFRKKMKR